MNVVREINKINQAELDLGVNGSWHDEYKDSAYVYVGGLDTELTEGDVVIIFSQYGEVMDLNMPRDKETGKPRGFAFLMYEDQRSTVLAVDNLNGAKVQERTLRVDHVKNYKQKGKKGDNGEWEEPEEQSFNARPQLIDDGAVSDSSASSGPAIDPEDPMAEFLLAQRKEQKALKKSKKSKGKHKNETPEERHARKAKKKEKKAKKAGKSEAIKGVEDLLASLGGAGQGRNDGIGRRDRGRSRSRTPPSRRRDTRSPIRERPPRRGSPSGSRSRSPVRTESRPHTRDDKGERRSYSRDTRSQRPRRDYD
ncbi:hypothetical protein HWV62_9111 [Athelia sp. TMB]|nr:hypothetical protein HWV62_32399 [Athelia sp. TMB]KAF7975652.1 hypothetical protein HWV62_9111 [Athelia sp. TMB]